MKTYQKNMHMELYKQLCVEHNIKPLDSII